MSGQVAAGGNRIEWTVQAPIFQQFQAQWQAALAASIAQVGETFAQAARQAYQGTRFAPAFTLTTQTAPVVAIRLVQTHPLFAYVEYPTRAHMIRPRNARFLVFTINGRRVFARSVNHPGTKGRNAMDRLFQQAANAFERALRDAGYQVLTRGL